MENDYSPYDSHFDELIRKINLTKSVRFRAYDRLSKLGNLSWTTMSFLSSYIIILSLINIFLNNIGHVYSNVTPYLIVAVALILLVFNLTESKKEYKVTAEKMHNCARELLRLELETKKLKIINDQNLSVEYISKVSEKYANILDKYEGHSSVDYNIILIYNKQMKKESSNEPNLSAYRKNLYIFDYKYRSYLKYWALLAIPIPVIIYFLFPIVKAYCEN
ncbi:MAG: SLATT domain-containing protein [Streptococcus sp.]|nr:SLATT domain-containing protein [Streptococcus sp.]